MKIPLANKLKKRLHVDTASLQDEMVDIVYSVEENAILHGGTTIWRCYEGNRFSEYLDFYMNITEDFEEKLTTKLSERNLRLLKYKKTHDVVFSKITDGTVEVRLEINIGKKIDYVVRTYEKADGSYMDIFTLSPEQLIIEKINAYASRKFIRDIYDIYHLSKYIKNDEEIKEKLETFLTGIEKPLDEENLKTLIFIGAVPSFKQMTEVLTSRFSI